VANGFKLTSFGVRLSPDVAYDGDPNTGYSVLDSANGGWFQVGGTSAGAPQWAALMAVADQGRQLAGLPPLSSTQTLDALYGIYSGTNGTSYTSNFHDITKGYSTGAYNVVDGSGNIVGRITVAPGPGYDMVTGVGSPAANVLAVSLASAGTGKTGTPPLVATAGSSTANSGRAWTTWTACGKGPDHAGRAVGRLRTPRSSWASWRTARALSPLSGSDFACPVGRARENAGCRRAGRRRLPRTLLMKPRRALRTGLGRPGALDE
jgi:hypothetical protein